MTTEHYASPDEASTWAVPTSFATTFNWEYDRTRQQLLTLYGKGKQKQWDAEDRIDWSLDVDPSLPDMPEYYIPIFGSQAWERLNEAERAQVRHHMTAWINSQFLHGEQGALVCTSKIVMSVPDMDSKFYAATQVMDEARHVEVYDRYLREKMGLAYPANPHLKLLLDQVLQDSRWDFTYLGMQIMIEGLALAAFALIRDFTTEPLAQAINTYVMQDEARHVAFGRLALRDVYPQMSEAERRERQEFVCEASQLMYNRFLAEEVWQTLGLDTDECLEYVRNATLMRTFRGLLFSRIVPTIKDIGLWGPLVEETFAELGVLQFRDTSYEELAAADEALAEDLDRRRQQVEETIAVGAEGI